MVENIWFSTFLYAHARIWKFSGVAGRGQIDTEMGLRYCAGEKELYMEMLSDFAAACEEETENPDALYREREWKEYQVKVHAAKSNAKMIWETGL